MKIRQFNQDLFLPPAIIGKPDGTVISVPHPSGEDSRKIAWLYSALQSYNGSGGVFRPCIHTKVSTQRFGPPQDKFVSTFDLSRHTSNTCNWAINSIYDLFASIAANREAGLIVDPDTWKGKASDALESMKPSLTANNSLVNFLIELRDFKNIGGKLVTLFKQIKSGRAVTAPGRDAQAQLTKDAAWEAFTSFFGNKPWNHKRPKNKRASDAWLQWRLAWAPFVSDVQKLTAGILSFERDVRSFLNREGKQQQRYWGSSIPNPYIGEVVATGTYIPPELYYINNLDVQWGWQIEEQLLADPRFNATMRYRYLLTAEVREAARTLNGFLDRLGINGNPAILWNAIPFTFVVDWFVNIGGYLNKLRVDNVRPTTEISDFCSSVKAERKVRIVMWGRILGSSGSGTNYSAITPFTAMEALSSYYQRRAEMPALTLTYGAGLTPTRLITALSLLNSNRR